MNCTKNLLPMSTASPWLPPASAPPEAPSHTRIGDADNAGSVPTKPGAWKRFLDVACLIIGLPGVLLLLLGVGLFVRAVSPGPVFFQQERIGYRRKRFVCFKFRTMRVGADTAAHQDHVKDLFGSNRPMVKMDAAGDPRLIPGGRFLRATGLDELPQLLNVLRGEMSLVGPRPCTPYEMGYYRPEDYGRFEALPGLTGAWQVKGKNKTTFREMIRLDIQYAQNQSPWLDLQIMAATFSTIADQVKDLRGRSDKTP